MEERHASIEQEIAREKAAALGRCGRKLETALNNLRRFDEGGGGHGAGRDQRARAELVEIAGDILWSYIVQREAIGLMDREYIGNEYKVPPDVWRRMRPRLSC
jgi:hypothetical protein